jgi:hypothetical protein
MAKTSIQAFGSGCDEGSIALATARSATSVLIEVGMSTPRNLTPDIDVVPFFIHV